MTTPTTEAGRALLLAFTTKPQPDDAIRISEEGLLRHAIPRIEREAVAAALDAVERRLSEMDDARLADSAIGSTRAWGMVRRVDVLRAIREVRERP